VLSIPSRLICYLTIASTICICIPVVCFSQSSSDRRMLEMQGLQGQPSLEALKVVGIHLDDELKPYAVTVKGVLKGMDLTVEERDRKADATIAILKSPDKAGLMNLIVIQAIKMPRLKQKLMLLPTYSLSVYAGSNSTYNVIVALLQQFIRDYKEANPGFMPKFMQGAAKPKAR